jgi:CDP-diglyceride synthetase
MNTLFLIGYLVIFISSSAILWNIFRKDENADWPWIWYLGGITFFVDKSGFTKKRFMEIHNECLKRGFNVQDYSNSWDVCDDIYMNDYKPTKKEYNILLDGIG